MPVAEGTMGTKASATVSCTHCAWAATHRADTLEEVFAFLHPLLVRHCYDRHPEKFPSEARLA
jgi:hypothetical protein